MPTTKSRPRTHTTKATAKPESKPEVQVDPKPESQLPKLPPMTKTEAYALIKRSREGLRDADQHVWKGTADQVQEDLLETITCATHVLDALKHRGIKGLV